MNESTAVRYFAPDATLAPKLGVMARQSFSEAFAHLYEPIPFARFLEQAYGTGGVLERDLCDPTIRWRAAAADDSVIGYAKLTPLRAPVSSPKPQARELQQIYVLRAWHGRGVARTLMDWAIETARTEGAPELYLTVFDHNERAKRFYARYEFAEIGRCTFTIGDRVDDDRIWRKLL